MISLGSAALATAFRRTALLLAAQH